MRPVEIVFPVPVDRAFAYLADPRNRPQWQSSLRAVVDVRREGAAWTDVTVVPGVRPRMRTTISEPPYRWAEEGRWGPLRARLELRLEPQGTTACRVSAEFAVRSLGVGRLVGLAARAVVADDLQRAAGILAGYE